LQRTRARKPKTEDAQRFGYWKVRKKEVKASQRQNEAINWRWIGSER